MARIDYEANLIQNIIDENLFFIEHDSCFMDDVKIVCVSIICCVFTCCVYFACIFQLKLS